MIQILPTQFTIALIPFLLVGSDSQLIAEDENPVQKPKGIMSHRLSIMLLFLTCFCTSSRSAEPSFQKDLRPYLSRHCVRCHNAKKQEGEFRLDALSKDVGVNDVPMWAEVMERINSGEMPPEDVKNRPSADESAAIVAWIATRIKEGEAARMARRDRVRGIV